VLNTLKRDLISAAIVVIGVVPAAPLAAHPASSPALTIVTPATGTLGVGQTFTLQVNLNTNTLPITSRQFGFTYDPTIVQLLNGSGSAVNVGDNL
jgi:hypothetical protein